MEEELSAAGPLTCQLCICFSKHADKRHVAYRLLICSSRLDAIWDLFPVCSGVVDSQNSVFLHARPFATYYYLPNRLSVSAETLLRLEWLFSASLPQSRKIGSVSVLVSVLVSVKWTSGRTPSLLPCPYFTPPLFPQLPKYPVVHAGDRDQPIS